ncbi:SseB family protein [Paracoccus sp. (in: a-proteobacteria)]|uniref:SseB family protein n=1 Tax=Paracoccus sp. TaxID=267 RepID=UPI00289D8E2D|nr:SseB family protein [Paracoccus sp. (in: a-proteobacteria)]
MTVLDELCPIPFHEASEIGRARILSRLADTELFVALTREPSDDRAELQIFELSGLRAALACDAEDRLADFFGRATAYVAMPGRVLAAMLAEEQAALLVNPGQLSEMFLDAGALEWLGQALAIDPSEGGNLRPSWMTAPTPEAVALFLEPLALRLGDMIGLASGAALVAAVWPDGRRGHLLLLRGCEDDRRAALAKAFAEFFAFLPPIEGGVDIGFAELELPQGALLLEVPTPPADAGGQDEQDVTPLRDLSKPPRLR